MAKERILITGKGSYVGTSLVEWLKQWPDQYEVTEISVRGEAWKKIDFSKYDSVLHVAGIAHVSTNPKMENEYYKVNRDLTIDVAKHAKAQGVKHFLFMSSIIIYGDGNKHKRVIDKNTTPLPSNFYGISKLQAEEGLLTLKSKDFKIAIIRPPMIYGKNSKGNYQKLASAAKNLPVFPDFQNERSMLHIDNLSELLRLLIKDKAEGIYFPQNREYVNTSKMVKLISEYHGKKVLMTRVFNFVLKRVIEKNSVVNKVFGNLTYDKSISMYHENYQVRNFKESIEVTENS